jgi:hypothetical protein
MRLQKSLTSIDGGKKGFDLKAAHINAVEQSRKLKPDIPLFGMDNIPIKHELEFEIILG